MIWSLAKSERRNVASKRFGMGPHGRRRRRKEKPINLWMQEVITGMREKGINSMKWIDRED